MIVSVSIEFGIRTGFLIPLDSSHLIPPIEVEIRVFANLFRCRSPNISQNLSNLESKKFFSGINPELWVTQILLLTFLARMATNQVSGKRCDCRMTTSVDLIALISAQKGFIDNRFGIGNLPPIVFQGKAITL